MNPNSIKITHEKPGDEEAIDLVNCRAFGKMEEAHLVRLLRDYYPCFDPRYSVTAWDGDDILGHILFNPVRIPFMGKIIDAIAPAPVCVIPERQNQGICGLMMQYCHDLARREGFEISFLNGHPDYYPRQGYKACFGFGKININTDALPEPSQKLSLWPVQHADIPWLVNCYYNEWHDVDFAWMWGNTIHEWTLPGTEALIWRTADGSRAAYSLGWPERKTFKMILGDDPQLVKDAIATIKPESLEQHPSGYLAKNVIDPAWGEATNRFSTAAMALELKDGVLQPYIDAVEAGERLHGFCNWSIVFMLVS